jgi:hypothetical protein
MPLSPPAKGVLWLICGLILLILAVPGTWLLVNVYDAPLDPQVLAVLERKYDTIAPAENLFYALLALNSQDAGDINAQGQRLYTEYLRQSAAHAPERTYRFDYDGTFARQPFEGNQQLLCGSAKPQEYCLERARSTRKELEQLLASNRLLLDRYGSLQHYRHLQDPVHLAVNSLIVQWQPFRAAKRLWLTDVALQIDAGNRDAAIDALREEIAFTRRMLAEPDLILIDKMMLAASLRDSLRLISDLMRQVPLSQAQFQALQEMNPPLTDDERSLSSVFAREFTGFADLAQSLGDSTYSAFSPGLAGSLQSRFLKVHATLNLKWSTVEKTIAESRASCEKLPREEPTSNGRAKLPFYDYVYNPIGKILVVVSATSGLDFLETFCDLEGMRRIVALQAMLRARQVPDEEVAEFLKRAGSAFGNPYTGLPMQWNAASHALTFEPLAPRDGDYFPWAI